MGFISDSDQEDNLAEAAGPVYADMIVVCRLLEAANLSEKELHNLII